MLFTLLQDRLIVHIRNRIRAGELTERNLARLTSMSQPHLHNVLKGVRSLSPEYADQIVEHLHLSVADLLSVVEIGLKPVIEIGAVVLIPRVRELDGLSGNFVEMPASESYPVPLSLSRGLVRPAMLLLTHDARVYPEFQDGDLALIDRAPITRETMSAVAIYLVKNGERTVLRCIRTGGRRLYLVTRGTLNEPRNWEPVPLPGQDLNLVIKGRLVWIGRRLPGDPIGLTTIFR